MSMAAWIELSINYSCWPDVDKLEILNETHLARDYRASPRHSRFDHQCLCAATLLVAWREPFAFTIITSITDICITGTIIRTANCGRSARLRVSRQVFDMTPPW